jgi:hypothetical protein
VGIGRTIGRRYVIVRPVGAGGMATVYHARDIQEGPSLIAVGLLLGTTTLAVFWIKRKRWQAQNG